MAKILLITALLRGKTPIMMNPMSPETLDALRTKQKLQINTDTPVEQIAAEKIWQNENGDFGVPAEALFSCLNAAGRKVEYKGKKALATATSSLIPTFLTLTEAFYPFTNVKRKKDGEAIVVVDGKEQPAWVADKRRGTMKTGASSVAVCIVRPKFPFWDVEVSFEYDADGIANEETVKKLFTEAGNSQGLGSFRPNQRGPFGRFRIVEWRRMSVKDVKQDIKVIDHVDTKK